MDLSVNIHDRIITHDAFVDLRTHRRTNPDADHISVRLFALILCWRDNASDLRASFETKIAENDQIISSIIVTPAGPHRTEMHRVGMLSLSGDDLRS